MLCVYVLELAATYDQYDLCDIARRRWGKDTLAETSSVNGYGSDGNQMNDHRRMKRRHCELVTIESESSSDLKLNRVHTAILAHFDMYTQHNAMAFANTR